MNPPQESDILLYSRNECPFNLQYSATPLWLKSTLVQLCVIEVLEFSPVAVACRWPAAVY